MHTLRLLHGVGVSPSRIRVALIFSPERYRHKNCNQAFFFLFARLRILRAEHKRGISSLAESRRARFTQSEQEQRFTSV